MQYLISAIYLLMSIGVFTCGVQLWRRRDETGDHSRHIQAVLSWIASFIALMFIFRTLNESLVVNGAYLEPEHTFVPLLCQMTFFLYPLEVIRPVETPVKVYTFLFTPLLLLLIIGMCAGIEYTPIHTRADLLAHIWEPNVIFRIFTLVVMLFYAFSLFLVSYNTRKSSADSGFIRNYAIGFCLIGVCHFCAQFSHAYIFVLLHQIVWMGFLLSIAYYELRERLPLPKKDETVNSAAVTARQGIWKRILLIVEENEGWKRPELGLQQLADELSSNHTYVSEAFKENTGQTFNEYISKRRIMFVLDELKRNPNANIHELFSIVGYRQRSTAVRNFQKITGFTPAEYLERQK